MVNLEWQDSLAASTGWLLFGTLPRGVIGTRGSVSVPFQAVNRSRSHPLLVGRLGVALDFRKRLLPDDGCDLVRAAAGFRQHTCCGLPQAVHDARVGESSPFNSVGKPYAQAVAVERAAVRLREKAQL